MRKSRYFARDWIRSSQLLRAVSGRLIELIAARMDSRSGKKLAALARAARATPGVRRPRLERRLQEELARVDVSAVHWDAICEGRRSGGSTIRKAIILKPPVSDSEKGVLFSTFESQWATLLRSGKVDAIAKRYDLVLGPTWSPPPDATMLMASLIWPERLYTLLANSGDAEIIRDLAGNIEPIPLMASSWANPDAYEPHLGKDKEHDIVMVASFSAPKRHWLFFDALRRLPKHLNVLLVGCADGDRTAETIRAESRDFGVENRFLLRVGARPEEIPELLCRSRVSLIFSRQEGACVAVAESMMAGTPVGLFRDAHVGSKAFINSRTGILLDQRSDLAAQILRFVESHADYDPRPWALENISCRVSSHILNEALREGSRRRGRPWTRDIAVIYKNSTPGYLHPGDGAAMRQAYDDFQKRFGLEIVRPAEVPGSQIA